MTTRGAQDDVVYGAVMAMKQAVNIAVTCGDIRHEAVWRHEAIGGRRRQQYSLCPGVT